MCTCNVNKATASASFFNLDVLALWLHFTVLLISDYFEHPHCFQIFCLHCNSLFFFCHRVEDLSCQKKDTGISFWFMCLQNYRTDLCSALAIMSSVAESNAILPSNSLIKRREDMSHMTLPLAAIACQQRRCQTHWVQTPAFQSYIIENPPILGLQAGTFPAWLETCRLTEEKKKQWVKSKSFPRW